MLRILSSLSDDVKQKLWFYAGFVFALLSLLFLLRIIYLFQNGEIRFLASGGVQMTISEPTLKRPQYNWRQRERKQVVLPRLYPIVGFVGPLYWFVMTIYAFIMSNLYKSSNYFLRRIAYYIWIFGSLIWFGIDFYIRWQAWYR